MKSALLTLVIALATAVTVFAQASHPAPLWVPIDTALNFPVNSVPLTADGDAADEGVVYNESGMDLTFQCLDDNASPAGLDYTSVTPTTSGIHDWTHDDLGMYYIEVPGSGGTFNNDQPRTCRVIMDTSTTLLSTGPWVRMGIPGEQGGFVLMGLNGADGSTSQVDIGLDGAYANDHWNYHAIGYYDSSAGITYYRNITDYDGTNALATVDTNLPTPESSADYWIIYSLRQSSAPTNFPAMSITAGGLVAIDPSTSGLRFLPTDTAASGIQFIPYDSNGDITKDATSFSCEISLDGGAFSSLNTPNYNEVESTNGAYWEFDLIQSETNGNRAIVVCSANNMVTGAIGIEFQN